MKYEILSKTKGGKLVAVVSTEASNETEALAKTKNFCYMMDIVVHGVMLADEVTDSYITTANKLPDVDRSLVHGPI